jgi:hypothetical protein
MANPANDDSVQALLVEFEREAKERAPAAAGSLSPPADDQQIDELAARLQLPFPIPADVRHLWKWHAGQEPLRDWHTFANVWFYPFPRVEDTYRMGLEAQEDMREELPDLYRPEWLPIADIAQNEIVVDCSTGELLVHSFFEGGPILGRLPSLAAVLGLWLRALREGAWLFPEGEVPSIPDEQRCRAIANSPDELRFII